MLKLDQTRLFIGFGATILCKLIGGGITLFLNGVINASPLNLSIIKSNFYSIFWSTKIT